MGEGFTLLELIVVIIIIGILATLGVTQYGRVIERMRTAEAKIIIGQIRTLQQAYYLQNDKYADDVSAGTNELGLEGSGIPKLVCQSTHYFRYITSTRAGGYSIWADRCTSGGKSPDAATTYQIEWYYTTDNWGIWQGTPGYY